MINDVIIPKIAGGGPGFWRAVRQEAETIRMGSRDGLSGAERAFRRRALELAGAEAFATGLESRPNQVHQVMVLPRASKKRCGRPNRVCVARLQAARRIGEMGRVR